MLKTGYDICVFLLHDGAGQSLRSAYGPVQACTGCRRSFCGLKTSMLKMTSLRKFVSESFPLRRRTSSKRWMHPSCMPPTYPNPNSSSSVLLITLHLGTLLSSRKHNTMNHSTPPKQTWRLRKMIHESKFIKSLLEHAPNANGPAI